MSLTIAIYHNIPVATYGGRYESDRPLVAHTTKPVATLPAIFYIPTTGELGLFCLKKDTLT